MSHMQVVAQDPATGEKYSFDPGRDIVYFWPTILRTCIQHFRQENWAPMYRDFLTHNSISEEVLLQTLRDYSIFIDLSRSPDVKTLPDAIEQSGFGKRPIAAQMAVLIKLGQIGSGAFWAGIRHSVTQGVLPETISDMCKKAEEMLQACRKEWNCGPGESHTIPIVPLPPDSQDNPAPPASEGC